MTALPLPPPLRAHVDASGRANRSLVFYRGFDGYDDDWSIPTGEKQRFLEEFLGTFSAAGEGYGPFVERRRQALGERLGAQEKTLYSQSRLVVGLGLPHPTETALLFDRLTGCPYVPGSSVKGVLRAAARLVAAGELTTADASDGAFWNDHLDRLFGPVLDGETPPARGELVVYDAFPDRWPTLELDVLTPHYQPYYGDEGDDPQEPEVPADWHDPNPVAFLTVKAGTKLSFWLGHVQTDAAAGDLEAAGRLLEMALDWLGLGGKTSSGYGRFGAAPPAAPSPVAVEGSAGEEPPPPAEPTLRPGQVLWKGAELYLDRRNPTVRGPGGETARGFRDDIDGALFNRLDLRAVVNVDAIVQERGGGRWSLVRIEKVLS